MRIKDIKPHIVGLTEIKAKNQVYPVGDSEFEIPNYDMFLNKNSKRGIALYFDKTLNARECDELNDTDFEESLWCTFKGANDESVLIGCLYRSPSAQLVNTEKLIQLLKCNKLSHYDKICIFGDFNFPDICWDGTWRGESNNQFIECLRDAFLIQKVTEPTRHREGQQSTLIDLVLVSEEDLVSEILHMDPLGKSDHDLLKFDLYVPRARTEVKGKYRYDLGKGNYELMREKINNFDFSALEDQSVEEMWSTVSNLVRDSMEECIPKVQSGNGRRLQPSWMNFKVKKSVKKKYNLYKKYLQTKRGMDYEKYKKERNNCNGLIKSARKKYEKHIAHGCKSCPKQFWRYVQEQTKSNTGISALKTGDGEYAVSDQDKAETLNNFFSSVFTDEDTSNIPDLSDCSLSDGISVSDIIITPEAVKNKLKDLDVTKAQGPDGIPSRVLKELSTELCKPFCLIFNKSLETQTVPSDWRRADVTAIFKKGSKSEPGNYRPVSLTCIACKVMESIVRDVMVSHFTDNKLYAKCQHGFRRKRSCVTQLMEVMEDLTALLDDKNPVDIIYLDFRKAFDSVPHERLLRKMSAYGITGNILGWTRSFLTGRVQKVKIGDASSSDASVRSGIPQGSILGPVLFTIYINDLPECVQSSCKVFADDTKIYGKAKNSHSLQEDIDKMQKWTLMWNLYFNADKCKVLHLGTGNPCFTYTMKTDNVTSQIVTCDEEKDLGVTFDKSLSFDPHIQSSINKANKMIGLIKRTFTYMDRDTFLKLYKALVRPHVEYGNVIWHPHLKRQSVAIERVQRRATKLLKECKNMNYSERLDYLKLHSLKGRRIRGDLIETYKLYNGFVDIQWDHFFSDTPYCNTRNAEGKIFIERCKSNLRKFWFSNRVANLWNNLGLELKNAPTTNNFKNQLDEIPKFIELFYGFDK